ncbi:alpha/beta fold hydrolase [Rhizomonospora bruguierae]|uniref:alpha/beta fold hydrolase n=1 Tax=Rhizomonospora bruguierae TaxID=1581705 RepID=UPI0020BDEED6|nr:alpha/beta hydrolase [Micromonospora sp. NBRC 107566]
MTETVVRVNGVELCIDTIGDPADPPVLLIAGAASSMDAWDPEFCARLARGDRPGDRSGAHSGGRYVIRYDHRDTGRSVSYPPGAPGYSGPDLVADAAGVIEARAGGRAHVVGVSMGGGIAQVLAVKEPERVASLTLIATSPGPGPNSGLPPVTDRMRAVFENPPPEPDWTDPEAVVEYLVADERPYAGPGSFDEARVRAAARRTVERTANPRSPANHWHVGGGEDTRPHLGGVKAPTLVIHGTADPLFPPAHGRALAEEIPGAELLLLEGVGHQVPPPSTWETVIPAILRHTR